MTASLEFGVDRLSVYNDVKNTSRTFLQLRLDSIFLLDFGCDTRSTRQVVSFTAVLDQDLHGTLLLAVSAVQLVLVICTQKAEP